jgi:hypothetical protein
MLPEYWLHDRTAPSSPQVAMLRLAEDSPAGAIVDLRTTIAEFLRENRSIRHLVVDIREHDARCAGTRPAMWELADASAEHGCRVIFVAHSNRSRDELAVVRSDEEAMKLMEPDAADERLKWQDNGRAG